MMIGKSGFTSGCINCTSLLKTNTTALTAKTIPMTTIKNTHRKHQEHKQNPQSRTNQPTSIHNEIEEVKDLLRRPSIFWNSPLDSHKLNLPNKQTNIRFIE